MRVQSAVSFASDFFTELSKFGDNVNSICWIRILENLNGNFNYSVIVYNLDSPQMTKMFKKFKVQILSQMTNVLIH